MHINMYIEPQMRLSSDQQFVTIPELLPQKRCRDDEQPELEFLKSLLGLGTEEE